MHNIKYISRLLGWIILSFALLSCGDEVPIQEDLGKDDDKQEEFTVSPIDNLTAGETRKANELQLNWSNPDDIVSVVIWYLLDGDDEANSVNTSVRVSGEDKSSYILKLPKYGTFHISVAAVDKYGKQSKKVSITATPAKEDAPPAITVRDGESGMPFGGGFILSQYPDLIPGNYVDKVVDNSLKTKYVVPHKEFYIIWTCNESAIVNQYFITSAEDSPQSDPTSWSLYGSNNMSDWTLLDTRNNQEFSTRGEVKEYLVTNNTEYKHYKLEILGNGGAPNTQIAEWSMAEFFTDIDELMVHATGFSFSTQTPMGNRYANRHVTTDEDREWLLDPHNEPPAPASASHLSPVEFPVTLYPYGKPSPADVNQHAIGDCAGLAALASLAYIYPDFVTSLIKDNGDKTYTVSMFDPQGKPIEVTVTNLFLSGNGRTIDAVSGKNNTATWATVLEKAIMKYNCIYKVNPDIGGIGSEHTLPLFTGNGNSFAFAPGKLSNRQLARAVKVSLANGKLIVGGFNKDDLPLDGSKTVTYHGYTLMHSSNKGALFSMRNPWGGNPGVDGRADGVLNIPNNTLIPPTIDLRIVDPGIAANFGNGITEPYTPPTLKASEMQMRVAPHLLRPVAPM